MEEDLERRVREALETPPIHDEPDNKTKPRKRRDYEELDQLNAHIHHDMTTTETEYVRNQRWRVLQAKRRMQQLMHESAQSKMMNSGVTVSRFNLENLFADQPANETEDECSSDGACGTGYKYESHYARVANKALSNFGALSELEKHQFYYAFTRRGFLDALRTGKLPDGSEVRSIGNGKYIDGYGIIRDKHGPFWPSDYGPLHPTPVLKKGLEKGVEEFYVYGEGKFMSVSNFSC